ncbi:restriction endonuclease, partial [Micrococcus luteus]|nr:restriction endonuclease [Micrococcus luteus]MCV7501561.1 restriction endonuclease [Micrococcus luteus]MCV7560360.1 restriction endonuclease [Micrococcus luteus]MCV7561702.1 restriction endonuclease [Micrococcus luteus]
PLGLDAPTLIVEVKSEPTPIGSRVLRGLHSAMTQHRADQALLVAWGGVTRPAELEFKRDRTTMRIWDADALLDQLFLTYDRLPASTRARIPLQQVWVLEDEG